MPELNENTAREEPRGFFALRPLHIDLGDVIVQIFAVALGVILGFTATAWSDRLHQRELLHQTTGNIVAELRSNQQGMRAVMPAHARLAEQLAAILRDASATQTVSLKRVTMLVRHIRFAENIPLGIAWQIAQNDQGLTLLPYEDRYDLAWIYQLQTFYFTTEERVSTALVPSSAPPDGNYFFAVASVAREMESVIATEQRLDALYSAALQHARSEFGE